MTTNVVELIRPDCEIWQNQRVLLTADQIRQRKNYFKSRIYHALNKETVGKSVIIWTNDLSVILPAIQAIWELGAAVVVHHFIPGYQNYPAFSGFYEYIDLYIAPDPGARHNAKASGKIDDFQGLNVIYVEPAEIQKFPKDTTLEFVLDSVVTLDSVAVKTHTSGTTGQPKIIDISHGNAIDLVKETARLFRFNEQDRVMHYKTLHHGSLFLNYAMPAFMTTHRHFNLEHSPWSISDEQSILDFLNYALEVCDQQQITKWLVPYDWLKKFPRLYTRLLPQLSVVTVIGPEQSVMQEILERFKFARVYNNFGCSELGTLFVSDTDLDNVAHYDPRRFTQPNRLISIDFRSDHFTAAFVRDQDYKTVGDILEQKNDEVWWHGRNTFVTVDGHRLDTVKINKVIETLIGSNNFSLVSDFQENKIYLAIFSKNQVDLAWLNSQLALEYHPCCSVTDLDYFDLDHYLHGMKPSQPLLLYFFKNKITDVSTTNQ